MYGGSYWIQYTRILAKINEAGVLQIHLPGMGINSHELIHRVSWNKKKGQLI
jgi:hypothetical protein